ncbi:MAG: hypothetical protein KDA78_21355 [Planctomycetaceae bacterium]|nr:hypothetical protein [Planctomycetaceae bacterium]
MNLPVTVLAQGAQPNPIALIVLIIAFGIGMGIALLVYTVVLRASLKWIANIDASFGSSVGTAFLILLISIIQSILFRLALYGSLPQRGESDISALLGIPIALAFHALIIGARFELSFLKACLVELCIFLIYLMLAFVTFIIVFVVAQSLTA